MKLNQLADNAGARRKANRVGRGIGSGNGKTAGRGQKGQLSRSGGGVMPGFEGGQMPLYRRLPMRGFNNANFRKEHVTINLADLQKMVDAKRLDASKTITLAMLQEAGFTKKTMHGLKVLGNGDIKAKLNIEAAAVSKSAEAKITKAGGSVTIKALKETSKFLPTSALKRAAAAAAK